MNQLAVDRMHLPMGVLSDVAAHLKEGFPAGADLYWKGAGMDHMLQAGTARIGSEGNVFAELNTAGCLPFGSAQVEAAYWNGDATMSISDANTIVITTGCSNTVQAAVTTGDLFELPVAEAGSWGDVAAVLRRLADWAGLDTDEPDWRRYASAFLYRDDEADPETRGAYKFPVVDIVEGRPVVVYEAVRAARSRVMQDVDVPASELDRLRSAVARLWEHVREATGRNDAGE